MKQYSVYLLVFTMGLSVSGRAQDDSAPIFFKDGNVGVNFLGFKASAGLGGILSGDASAGGLHAEAETPFGQKAGAGLGGRVDGSGKSLGGLYAGATAGGGVSAAAGLGGTTGGEGSAGASYAGSSVGGVSKTVIKERYQSPPASGGLYAGASAGGGIGATAELGGSVGTGGGASKTIVKESYAPAAESSGGFGFSFGTSVNKHVAAAPVKEKYVERTIIPNYVEKTIRVPSYEEKIVRVPTFVEKTIRVPAPPTVIEKTSDVGVAVEKEEAPVVVQTFKKRVRTHPHGHLHFRKYFGIGGNKEIGSRFGFNTFGGGYGGADYGSGINGGNQGTYTATVRKSVNPQLFTDIFNIPIATLGAVSKLVGGIAGGTSVSGSVSKSYSSY